MGLRRITALQYDSALEVVLGDLSRPARALLPEDPRTPFDTDYREQRVSPGLIEGSELLARDAAARLLEDTARRDTVVGCTPTTATDRDCMESFLRRGGRLALRRALTDEDVAFFLDGDDAFEGALASAERFDDFYEGVSIVVQLLLQDPEFLYRVEIGTPVPEKPGYFKLSANEVASRMAFFLWGSVPSSALLDLAEAGALDTAAGRTSAAMDMLEDPRARERFTLFHSMWLGYEKLIPGDELGLAMRAETEALFSRVLFDDEMAWQDVFRLEETYVNEILAMNYDLPVPESGSDWVRYEMDARRGLFSHGTFLSIGGKLGDTSPVLRGLAVQTRAFCRTINPAPPEVDVDAPPESDALCKEQRYAQHSEGGCIDCHAAMDPVGFGLEAFDQRGRFRTHEIDIPTTDVDESVCEIRGDGELVDIGTFSGPGELAELGLESGLLRDCFLKQMHRFVVGRGELDRSDARTIDELDDALGEGDFTLRQLVTAIVSADAFVERQEEEVE